MTATEDFINSLSDEDKKIIAEAERAGKLDSEMSQAELTAETIKGILNLQVASGTITESKRDEILSKMNL